MVKGLTKDEDLQHPGDPQSAQLDPASKCVQDEPEKEELHGTDGDLPDDRSDRRLPLDGGPDRHGDADPHNPDKPGEYQVRHVQS